MYSFLLSSVYVFEYSKTNKFKYILKNYVSLFKRMDKFIRIFKKLYLYYGLPTYISIEIKKNVLLTLVSSKMYDLLSGW